VPARRTSSCCRTPTPPRHTQNDIHPHAQARTCPPPQEADLPPEVLTCSTHTNGTRQQALPAIFQPACTHLSVHSRPNSSTSHCARGPHKGCCCTTHRLLKGASHPVQALHKHHALNTTTPRCCFAVLFEPPAIAATAVTDTGGTGTAAASPRTAAQCLCSPYCCTPCLFRTPATACRPLPHRRAPAPRHLQATYLHTYVSSNLHCRHQYHQQSHPPLFTAVLGYPNDSWASDSCAPQQQALQDKCTHPAVAAAAAEACTSAAAQPL
jgi:hypothetical protein